MMRVAAGILVVLAALSVTSSADNNYYATCILDPGVGVLNMRPGKVKGHTASSPAKMKRCRIGCTRQYSPVCGNDGTTYGNQCALCSAACHDHSLYLACLGECPCPVVQVADRPAGQDRGDIGVVTGEDTHQPPAMLGQNSQEEHNQQVGPHGREGTSSAHDTPSSRAGPAGPRKLKKIYSAVTIVTNIDLNIASGDITADALNQVTLDLHADMAPESNPLAQTSLWVVEVYYKGKGKSPKQGLVSQSLGPAQSSVTLDVGQPLDITGAQYELDLRGKSCEDAAKVCVRLKHQKTGKRRVKVIGRPTAKVLRSCAKVQCRPNTQS